MKLKRTPERRGARGHLGLCLCFSPLVPRLSQRRPLQFQPFAPDLPFADAKTLGDQLARLADAHLVVLGVDKGGKDLLAEVFRKLLIAWVLCHGTPSG